jgi:hypothetical protein
MCDLTKKLKPAGKLESRIKEMTMKERLKEGK